MKNYSELDGIKQNQQNELETAYNKGYQQGKKDAEKENENQVLLEDEWCSAKLLFDAYYRVFKMNGVKLAKYLGIHYLSLEDLVYEVTKKYTVKKLKQKIQALKEIYVGDEVMTDGGCIGIVTNNVTHYHVYYPDNGKTHKFPKNATLLKTGNRFKQINRIEINKDGYPCIAWIPEELLEYPYSKTEED